MNDPTGILAKLKRPRMLVRAARFGQDEYQRERDLARLLKCVVLPDPERSVDDLLEQEQQMEATRKAGDAGYSIACHVDLLIALMGEAQLLPRIPRGLTG